MTITLNYSPLAEMGFSLIDLSGGLRLGDSLVVLPPVIPAPFKRPSPAFFYKKVKKESGKWTKYNKKSMFYSTSSKKVERLKRFFLVSDPPFISLSRYLIFNFKNPGCVWNVSHRNLYFACNQICYLYYILLLPLFAMQSAKRLFLISNYKLQLQACNVQAQEALEVDKTWK